MLYQEFVDPESTTLCAPPEKTISIIHLNARSLTNKYDQFTFFLSQFAFRFNIIMLTETLFSSFDIRPY